MEQVGFGPKAFTYRAPWAFETAVFWMKIITLQFLYFSNSTASTQIKTVGNNRRNGNGNEITTVETYACHKQNDCYCYKHVYN